MAQPTTPGNGPEQPADERSGDRPRLSTAIPAVTRESAVDAEEAQVAGDARTRADDEPVDEAAEHHPVTALEPDDHAVARAAGDDHPIPAPPVEQPVAAPLAQGAEPPKRAGNRLVGTAWVLLASGVFEVVYLALLALVVLVLAGPEVVGPQLGYFAGQSTLLWLPLVFFFLLFELTVLLFNRAGRFLYIVASLLVGVIVYLLTVYLIAVVPNGAGDVALLRQSLVSPFFLVAGLAAREVMLWTGIVIGSRGIRVRRRNRAAKQRYEQEVADAGR